MQSQPLVRSDTARLVDSERSVAARLGTPDWAARPLVARLKFVAILVWPTLTYLVQAASVAQCTVVRGTKKILLPLARASLLRKPHRRLLGPAAAGQRPAGRESLVGCRLERCPTSFPVQSEHPSFRRNPLGKSTALEIELAPGQQWAFI